MSHERESSRKRLDLGRAQGPSPDDDARFERLYDELRRIAAGIMRRERSGHTLQATALVNELYLRLSRRPGGPPLDEETFFVHAAHYMREIVVDYARMKKAAKRGFGAQNISLDEAVTMPDGETAEQVLLINAALDKLESEAPRQSKIFEMKYFLGLPHENIASYVRMAVPTVKSDYAFARAFLRREISRSDAKCGTATL